MPEINVGDKIPGTYCPLCGEIGLQLMKFNRTTWAVCPMVDGEPVVKKLKDAHTAYVIDTGKYETEPEEIVEEDLGSLPEAEIELEDDNEEGVNHG
ncbi:MAG: hypothetical protein ACW99J_15540 [Candidatus Thorarchaeota archaeon]|jgi:hypothetical protein